MNAGSSPRSDSGAGVRAAAALFRLLLFACPSEMRAEYGAAMRADFAAAVREKGGSAAILGFVDVVSAGIAERAHALGRDLAFALRGMRRAPLFACVVVLTTAVAIGANGALNGLVANIVLRPLPIAEPSTLAVLWEVDRLHGYTRSAFRYDDYVALSGVRTLKQVAALAPIGGTLVGGSAAPRVVSGAAIAGAFFETYRVRPVIGRLLDERDERDGARPVVISDELWRSRFAANPNVLGRTVKIEDTQMTVVGVAPPGLRFVDLWRAMIDHADYFIPLRASAYAGAGHAVLVVARPAADLAEVDADLHRTFATLAVTHPATNRYVSARAVWTNDEIRGPMLPSLVAVSLAVLAVLAVACANVANLFLSRAAARTAEVATRYALGASRRRLIAQLLTETTLYVVLGGVLGIALAATIVHAIATTIDAGSPVVHLQHLDVEWKTFVATGASIGIAALLVGLAPAIALSRPDVVGTMKGSDRSGTGRGRAFRATLVTLEIALAIAIVATAAISARSYYRLANEPMGFDTRDVSVAFVVGVSRHRYDTAARADAFLDAVRSRVLGAPGVAAAAWAATTPFLGEAQASFTVQGARYAEGSEPEADLDTVSDEYLRALRVPVLAGRDFTTSDRVGAAPVAMVSKSFADRYLNGVAAAVGKHITIHRSTSGVPIQARTVVGVTGDIRNQMSARQQPTMYAPVAQLPSVFMKLVVRSKLSTVEVADIVRAAIAAVDKTVPPATATSLEHEFYYDALARRMTDIMLSSLAAIALALAVAGIYAVVSYSVACRTREIGVRAAFGASPSRIAAMVLRDAFRLAAVGSVLGVGLAGVSAWALKGFLDVDAPIDGFTAVTVLAIAACAIGLAAYLPARRAAHIDPVVALRYE